jgi:3,4-dihydroxy 2-butanone 4-phosphate synthase / GTP cyclohydrolase II
MARVPDLVPYAEKHGLKMITVADLIAYRRQNDRLIERVVDINLPTAFGTFTAVGYRSLVDDKHHVALVKGDVVGKDDVLVRVHSECLTGDVFHSLRCDCGEQLESALMTIEEKGEGVLLYLAQEGRGIGLLNKLRAYKLQEEGYDTVDANLKLGLPADLRDYGIGLEGYGLSVSQQVPIEHRANEHNETYMNTKRDRMGHILSAAVNGGPVGDPIHHQGLPLDEEMLRDEQIRDHRADGSAGAHDGDSEEGSR